MATAPVVIPYALTQLATGVVVDLTSAAAQTLFTTGPSDKAIPLFLVFRDASATVNGTTTYSLGVTGSAASLLAAGNTSLQALTAGGNYMAVQIFGATGATAKAYVAGNTNVILTLAGTLATGVANVKVDVYGALTVF